MDTKNHSHDIVMGANVIELNITIDPIIEGSIIIDNLTKRCRVSAKNELVLINSGASVGKTIKVSAEDAESVLTNTDINLKIKKKGD